MQKPIETTLGYVKKNGKLKLLLIIAAVGVALILIGTYFSSASSDDSDTVTDDRDRLERYVAELESEIVELCSSVRGVGNVRAVVTVNGGFEYVYACDTKHTDSSDSAEYIKVGSGSSQQALYLTEKMPEITGIGIVCSGGGKTDVCNRIVLLLSAAYGVPTNKIYVTEAAY